METKKYPTYSYETSNQMFPSISRINEINDEMEIIRKEMKNKLSILQAEKDEIQKKCIHEYHLTAYGAYDDSYECILCGQETER